jgi:hypothetical protein
MLVDLQYAFDRRRLFNDGGEMLRKTTDPAKLRSEIRSVRFSPGEWQRVLVHAARERQLPAEYLRLAALAERRRRSGGSVARTARRLRQIGEDLGRLLRAAEAAGRSHQADELAQLQGDVEELVEELEP